MTQPGAFLLRNLLLFGRVCKALGMDVNPGRMVEVARALEHVHIGRRDDFYNTLRALIVTHRRELPLFDEAFAAFWQKPPEGRIKIDLGAERERRSRNRPQFAKEGAVPSTGAPEDKRPVGERQVIVMTPTYSAQEILRCRDFALMTDDELALARRVMERLRWNLGTRATRRRVPGKGGILDIRRTVRQNLKFGGEPVIIPRRTYKIKPRPLVLICDISGSMERYTRLLLHFMHTVAQSIGQVESFVFGTRLTRITRVIRHRSIDTALRQMSASPLDWGGGTRIGASLHTFNFQWARRVLGQGAIVLLITDGWDRGDPALLQRETQRLQRNCYRLIWLNPLLGGQYYQPLTRGAQALLPYVDDFLPVHNLDSLEALARQLQRVNWRRPERGAVTAHAHLILED